MRQYVPEINFINHLNQGKFYLNLLNLYQSIHKPVTLILRSVCQKNNKKLILALSTLVIDKNSKQFVTNVSENHLK